MGGPSGRVETGLTEQHGRGEICGPPRPKKHLAKMRAAEDSQRFFILGTATHRPSQDQLRLDEEAWSITSRMDFLSFCRYRET